MGAVEDLCRPASSAPLDIAVWAAAVGCLLGSTVIAVLFLRLADRWWPATLLLFGPRWILLLPFAPALALAAWRDRAMILPLVIGLAVVIGPIMGFRTGVRSLLTFGQDEDLTVVSFNVAGGEELVRSLESMLRAWDADVAAFQECGRELQGQVRALGAASRWSMDGSRTDGSRTDGWSTEGWSTHVHAGLCLVSRFPITEVSVMDRDALRSVGGSGLVATYALDGPDGRFHLTNVHLETPRAGLELIRAGRLGEGIRTLRQKSLLREIELRRAARWAERSGPPSVAVGDFNTPPESRHYRFEWGDWTNAFSVAGFGIGGTRLNGWIRARIDHVLVDDRWTVVDSWLGEDLGSDHLPILARVRIR